ncbi:MAG TPA: hypothetical protein VEZ72_10460 [Paenibacillus sp.]|nr:hypothetical protein [Paenibacillus sp.]
MKTKTWWTVPAIAVLTAGLLVGCGGGEPAMDVPADGQGMEPGMTTPETPDATEETAAPEGEAAPESEAAPEATTE